MTGGGGGGLSELAGIGAVAHGEALLAPVGSPAALAAEPRRKARTAKADNSRLSFLNRRAESYRVTVRP